MSPKEGQQDIERQSKLQYGILKKKHKRKTNFSFMETWNLFPKILSKILQRNLELFPRILTLNTVESIIS